MRCPGCIAPELQPFDAGVEMDTEELSRLILSTDPPAGLTFSGGEPFAQARAVSELIDRVRAVRDMSVMSYTGYALGDIVTGADPSALGLLERLDVLVDGPYVQELHTDLIWRGSSNQQVHLLTERYADGGYDLEERGTRLEFNVDAQGGIFWMGIPPPGFRRRLSSSLAAKGVMLTEPGEANEAGKEKV